jgi:predicted phosphodiesterase
VKVVHGSPWDDPGDYRCEYVFARDAAAIARVGSVAADVILLGHTHVPMALRVADRLILNPGSCGEARDGSGRLTFAELDFEAGMATIFAIRPSETPEPIFSSPL